MKNRDVTWIYRVFLGFIYGGIISGILLPSLDSNALFTNRVNRWILGLTIFLGLDFFCRTRSWLLLESRKPQAHPFEWLALFELLGLMVFAFMAKGLVDPSSSDPIKSTAPFYAVFIIATALSNSLGVHIEPRAGHGKYFAEVICGNVSESWQLWGKWQKKVFQWTQPLLDASEGLIKRRGRIPIANLQLGNLGHLLGYSVRVVRRFYCQLYASHLVILNGFVGLLLLVRSSCKCADIRLSLGWPFGILLFSAAICYILIAHHEEGEHQQKRGFCQTIIDIAGNITFLLAVFNFYCYLNTDSLVLFMLWQQGIVAVLVIMLSKKDEQTGQKQSHKKESNDKQEEIGGAEAAPGSQGTD